MSVPRLIELPDEAATEALGRKLAQALLIIESEILQWGVHIRLIGELGAGKTFLTRSCLRALGYEGRVKSPTFSLLETYSLPSFVVNHFDFYRMESSEEFEDAGFREDFGPGVVCLTEWVEKAEPYVPQEDCRILLSPCGVGRVARLDSFSAQGSKILEVM